ncbi:MAG: hypothetical protein AABX33_07930 [Nanoarchaeota archaeon]
MKKSQIQIGETIAVLFVFFILVAVGFIFYAMVIKGNIGSEQDEASQLRAIGIAQRAMFLPELQCSKDVITEETDCIDILKLKTAEVLMKQRQNEIYYYDMFEFSEINITQIYPQITGLDKSQWTIYSRKRQNSPKFITNIPVSLYDSITKTYRFGILSVETFSK